MDSSRHRVTIETPTGARATGLASDGLPPLWFDKDPSRDFRANVEDQLHAVREARRVRVRRVRGRVGGDARRVRHDDDVLVPAELVRRADGGAGRDRAAFMAAM